MAYPADVTFTCGLLTFIVSLICICLVIPSDIFQLPVAWLVRKNYGKAHRRETARHLLSGVTAHVSDGTGYWRGSLVDASADGFCLDIKDAEEFSATQGLLGLLLEKEGNCLPVRVELKWKQEMPDRICLGLSIADQYWNWQKFQNTICRVAPAATREV